MKITARRVGGFLRGPDPQVRCVLIYGPDQGLARERADILTRGVVEDVRDPFLVVELSGASLRGDPVRLADEAAALAFTGGRRVVRVRDATDGLGSVFKGLLADTRDGALVIVEAGELGSRSSLRRLFEGADNAAAIPCYPDDARGLAGVIVETLEHHGLSAPADVIAYLADNLGADRMMTRNELEKVALYKGEPGSLTLGDVMACVGDGAATSLDAVALATASGDGPDLDHAMRRAFMEGISPVAVLRVVARHFLRLHLASGLMVQGRSMDQAMAALKPRVIFSVAERFRSQLRRWPAERLGRALEILTEAELECKSTGRPPEVICGRALIRIAQAASR
ncbi:MAG TPA: DNA polymerase III subunit delta [Rhodospirillales bacterium]|jgi:DNA polymerase-3 subunit delta|nr:DNA polymerase III subunit delta [Rhodospirillales bacterium]